MQVRHHLRNFSKFTIFAIDKRVLHSLPLRLCKINVNILRYALDYNLLSYALRMM